MILIISQCDGHRPELKDYIAPKGYIELMQECWNSDPIKRPSADDISKKLSDILNREVNIQTDIIKLTDVITPISNPKSKQLSSTVYTISSELGN